MDYMIFRWHRLAKYTTSSTHLAFVFKVPVYLVMGILWKGKKV